jgi:hypothetical protein
MVRTLKEAWLLGWRVRVKCDTLHHRKEVHRNPAMTCHAVHELDLKTLVRTRGALPINQLKERLKCPACESREILVFFEVLNEPAAVAARRQD